LLVRMATRKGMFAVFADEDEEVTQQPKTVKKVAAPAKTEEKKAERPQTAKPIRPAAINGAGFDGVTGAQENTGRTNRGGRGGDRGGRGGRGAERRGPRPEGAGAGRGDRRPRQEGDRPRQEGDRPRQEGDRPRTEGGAGRGERRPRPPRVEGGEGAATEGGDEGVVYRQRKERNVDHAEHRFEGKKRENYHPFDRRDGTGRGRGVAKGGHGKFNWGTTQDETKTAEEAPKETTETTEQPAEESKTEEAVERKEETPVVREPTEDDLNA
jgi:hypothetical protein